MVSSVALRDEDQIQIRFASEITTAARRIEDAWCNAQYHDDAFSDIAQQVLLEERLHERYSARDVIREGLTGAITVPQIDLPASFGQPPVTFFRNSRFYIAVLFWVDADTSIHEHSFSGAFSVLSGSSLHVQYEFKPKTLVNSRLSVGEIVKKHAKILERGDVEAIISGRQGAHALFHLKRPSATLLVRTHRDSRAQPQMTYHWPCYAIDPFFEDDIIYRKCQLLSLVRQTDAEHFQKTASELLLSLDLESAIRVLLYLRRFNLSLRQALDLASSAAGRQGSLGEGLTGFVEDGYRISRLASLHQRVFDCDRRLLLAFIMNRLSVTDIFALVKARYLDSEPADLVANWTASLLAEVGGLTESPLLHRAIRLLLTGNNLPEVTRQFALEFELRSGGERDAADELLRRLADSPVLSSLFGNLVCSSD